MLLNIFVNVKCKCDQQKVILGGIETHKSQNFLIIAPPRVAKLSTSHELTIFVLPVPYPFISDQCLKGDRWTNLFWKNSIVAMDL